MISYLISTDTILKLVALSSLNQYLKSYFKYLFLNNSYITLQPKTGCPLKLSRVEPSQYLDGRPPGKTRLLLEEV